MNRRVFLSLLGTAAVAAAVPLPDFTTFAYEPDFLRATAFPAGVDALGLREATRIVTAAFLDYVTPLDMGRIDVGDGARLGHTVCVRDPARITRRGWAASATRPVVLAHQFYTEPVKVIRPGREYDRSLLEACGQELAGMARDHRVNLFAQLPHPSGVDGSVTVVKDGAAVRGLCA